MAITYDKDFVVTAEIKQKFLEGDAATVEYVNEQYKRYFFSLLPKFSNLYTTMFSTDDALSCCYLGLFKAMQNFEPNRNTKFLTVLSVYARNEILMEVRKVYKKHVPISLDLEFDGKGGRGDGKDEVNFMESITDKEIEETIPENIVIKQLMDAEHFKVINGVFKRLPLKTKRIVSLYYNDELEQKEIAEKFGVSQSWISRIIIEFVKECKIELGLGERQPRARRKTLNSDEREFIRTLFRQGKSIDEVITITGIENRQFLNFYKKTADKVGG